MIKPNSPKDIFYERLRELKFPEPVFEHRFHEERLWRFDLAWTQGKVALEIEGGTWSGGRHSTGIGLRNDCYKYNSAVARGWIVLRATTDMLNKEELFIDLFDTLLLRGVIKGEKI